MGLFDALGVTSDTNKNIGATSYAEGNTDIRLNPWQRFLGATDEDAENARLKAQQKDLQSRYGAALATVGSTGVDWGETEQQVMGKIARLKEERQSGQDNKQLAQSLRITAEQQKPQMAQVQAGIKAQEAQTAQLIRQGNQSHQLALMQLADAADARATEFAYQKMRDRKADQQYNERMEMLDRKDRRAAMSSLAGGLAALGAAFAL